MAMNKPFCVLLSMGALLLAASTARAADDGLATDLKEKLLANLNSVIVTLIPDGKMDKPGITLVLSAKPVDMKKRPDTLADGIGENSMKRLINFLADEGTLGRAKSAAIQRERSPKGPRYLCNFSTPDGENLEDDWGWGKDLQARLSKLVAVLDGPAARDLRLLADRLGMKLDGEQATTADEPAVVNGLSFRTIVQSRWAMPAKDATATAT